MFGEELICLRCGHGSGKRKWRSRLEGNKKPIRCPVCQSCKWDIPREDKNEKQ